MDRVVCVAVAPRIPNLVVPAQSILVVVGQQRHIPRGRQGLRKRVCRFPRSGRAWVEHADAGGVVRHEHVGNKGVAQLVLVVLL